MNGFHTVGFLILAASCIIGFLIIGSGPRALGGGAVGFGMLAIAGGVVSSIVPFGFGAVVARLDAINHSRHTDRLDPDAQAAERKELAESGAESEAPPERRSRMPPERYL